VGWLDFNVVCGYLTATRIRWPFGRLLAVNLKVTVGWDNSPPWHHGVGHGRRGVEDHRDPQEA